MNAPMISRAGLSLISILCSMSIATAAETDWVATSNSHSRPVLEFMAKYEPEMAGELGVDGYDEAIVDLRPDLYARMREDMQGVLAQLQEVLANEKHPKVRQDLQILIQSLTDRITSLDLQHRLMLPYFDPAATAFQGVHALLDENVDKSRHPAAVVRLKKYAGLVASGDSIAELAKARTREQFNDAALVGPYQREVRRDLANYDAYLSGISQLMKSHGMKDWEEAHQKLTEQIRDYKAWIESDVLPRARDNHRLPEEIYADNLKRFGVDIRPTELIERAQFGFLEIRSEMQAIAKRLAADRGWEKDGYRDAIRSLKQEQLDGDRILTVYRQRLAAIEEIIRREKIVSLPTRKARIRLATEAESASQPVPNMRPPRLIGNTGQYGEFLIPLRNPNAESNEKMDDFLHDAITWSLTAHEARPGHEMQFSAMVETGVSIPRAVFAFNSANVEGWGMYSEAIMKEHFPLEGQLFTLYARSLRAARAFLDPMLNLGQMSPERAKQFLMEELLLSEPMATQEVDRYTFRMPGQATSYYYGLMKLESLRTRTEIALGDKFNQQAFHDFVLDQGLLPPELLAKAVMDEFVPSQSKAAQATDRASQ
jgi:uncharacterized protein (DUF885 family)